MLGPTTVKVWKHPKAKTLYLSIPSKMAQDSQFPIKGGDTVLIEWDSEDPTKLVIRKKES